MVSDAKLRCRHDLDADGGFVSLTMPQQNRLAWRLAGLLNTRVDRIFDWRTIWAAKAFIPEPTAIERLMVERGQYDADADPCEPLYDAIGRVYGDEALSIVKRLVGADGKGDGEKS